VSERRTPPSGAAYLEKEGHVTFHLTPAEFWEVQKSGTFYTPETFEREGFIHCTDSLDELIAVGNRYYRRDTRPYLALQIDCGRVAAPIVYEDQTRLFPHIYGPLEHDAVTAVLAVRRERSGKFVGLDPEG
jgi:uncharacterized protein (DUF952 family)